RRPSLRPIERGARDIDRKERELINTDVLGGVDDVRQGEVVLSLDDTPGGHSKIRGQRLEGADAASETVVCIGDVTNAVVNRPAAVERNRDLVAVRNHGGGVMPE